MFSQEPNAIRLAKRASIGLIVLSIALFFLLPREWIPHLPDVPRDRAIFLLLAVPMAALLLAYEIARSASGSLARRRNAKARDAEFLRRFTRASPPDREPTDP